MRIKSLAICAAAITLTATSTLAHQDRSNVADNDKQAGQKKICRSIERTGTRISERICLTAEQWRKVDEYISR